MNLDEKRMSKANLDSVQAVHDHAVSLGADCKTEEMESGMIGGAAWFAEAKLKGLKVSDSHAKHLDAVHQAVRAQYQDSPKYAYPRDVFDNHVVVQHGDKLFAHSYKKTDDGNVTLGDPTQVEATYQPMKEADFLETATNGIDGVYFLIERNFDKNVGGGVDRDKLKDGDFAGKNRSFPIVTAKDVSDALHSIGRAGSGNYSSAELKSRILSIARRKGLPVPASDEKESAGQEFAGDLVPLSEGALRKDGSMKLKIIQPGWGTSGYYPAEMLERDGPKVFTKGLHMYLDHPTPTEEAERPERSVKDLAATLTSNAQWMENGPAGKGLYADAMVLEPFRPFVEQAGPMIGVSIRAMGAAESGQAEGRKGPIIKSLATAKSIDFVTQAGAGGRVLPLYEAAHRRQPTHSGAIPTMDEKELQTLREAAAEGERLREVLILREAKDAVATKLAAIDHLPDMVKARLTESLAKNPPVSGSGKERKLDTAALETKITEGVKAEVAYLASLGIGDGKITGMGAPQKTGGDVDVKEAETELTSIFSNLGMKESTAKLAAHGRSR